MTIQEILLYASSYLKKRNVERYKHIAESIIAHILKIDRLDLYLQLDKQVNAVQINEIKKKLFKASKNIPLEYILGSVDFYGLTIKVAPSVLIPRVETELLFDHFVKRIKDQDHSQKTLIDLCCGSGCLAIAAKKKFSTLNVMMSDISLSALNVARENAQLNDVDVTACKGSLLQPFKGKRVDFILCNPPYLSHQDYIEANNPFEPKTALVAGDTGLEFFIKLAKSLPDHLHPKGKVFFEIGSTQKKLLYEIFNQPHWVKKEILSDWAGLDRFFFLEIE